MEEAAEGIREIVRSSGIGGEYKRQECDDEVDDSGQAPSACHLDACFHVDAIVYGRIG